jgi:hypothetical protein
VICSTGSHAALAWTRYERSGLGAAPGSRNPSLGRHLCLS